MQATGPPSRAPVYDGPFNCRPYLGVKMTGGERRSGGVILNSAHSAISANNAVSR